MKDLIILGAGFTGSLFRGYICETTERKVVAFAASKDFCNDLQFEGLPLITDDDIEKKFPPAQVEIVLALGYRDMNKVRMEKYLKFKKKGYDFYSYIHPSAIIHKTVKLGEGNLIYPGVIIGKDVIIGNANNIHQGCNFAGDIIIENYNHFAPGIHLAGFVQVKNNSFFGIASTVIPHVVIEDKTLIGAGAVITKNTEKNGVYVPAHTVKLSKSSDDICHATSDFLVNIPDKSKKNIEKNENGRKKIK